MVTILAPAKINLALDVISRRPDGYHEVDMVMQSIGLADQLTLIPAEQISINCTNPLIPTDRRNLVWRAIELLQNISGVTAGIKVDIEKKIPIAAGLAGGSSDAAAVLLALNKCWKLGFSAQQLMKIGVKLGADVPYCILQQTARAQGIGEKLTPLNSKLNCSVLVITPNVAVATALVYQQLDLSQVNKHPQIDKVIPALAAGDLDMLSAVWGNVLEEVVLSRFPVVAQVKQLLLQFGLKYCIMSGSGPSVFALNPSLEQVEALLAVMPAEWFRCLTYFKNRDESEELKWIENH